MQGANRYLWIQQQPRDLRATQSMQMDWSDFLNLLPKVPFCSSVDNQDTLCKEKDAQEDNPKAWEATFLQVPCCDWMEISLYSFLACVCKQHHHVL